MNNETKINLKEELEKMNSIFDKPKSLEENDIKNTNVNNKNSEKNIEESEENEDVLSCYFNAHEEELKTAGIEEITYLKDMKRAVKWHKHCSDIHWVLCGWWMTLIRTFILKAKPFKWFLNLLGILIYSLIVFLIVFLFIKIF